MKRVCEAWYSVPQNVIEELNNSMPRRNADLIKAKGAATKYWLYDVGVSMLLCFHWNILKYVVVFRWNAF